MNERPELEQLLDAAMPHVAFDGWSDATFAAAAEDAGIPVGAACLLAPRKSLDLAVAYHRRGDRIMVEAMQKRDLSELRYSERVAEALKLRVTAISDREAVRRATTLFSLPTHVPEGAKLVWETADTVWKVLGDTSTDGNWYSKRATLAAVWGSVVLYWLGDDSPDYAKTFDFVDRRIENVMQVEKMKGQLRSNPLTRPFMDIHASLMGRIHAPKVRKDVPGVTH